MHRLLDYILWMPLIGALLTLLVPSKQKNAIRWTALVTTTVTFILTVVLYMNFDNSLAGMQPAFNVKVPWIE